MRSLVNSHIPFVCSFALWFGKSNRHHSNILDEREFVYESPHTLRFRHFPGAAVTVVARVTFSFFIKHESNVSYG